MGEVSVRWCGAWLGLLLTAGCGLSDRDAIYDSELGLCNEGKENLYPLEPGAWWRVRVTDDKTMLPQCPDKVVAVERGGDVPHHAGTTGFAVKSVSKNRNGERWQGIIDDVTYRYVDIWRATPGSDPSSTKLFCPRKVRVPGGEAACEGQVTVDRYRSVTLTVDDEQDWPLCEDLRLDPESCEPLDEVPPQCLLEHAESVKTTTVIDAYDTVKIGARDVETGEREVEALHVRTDDGKAVVDFWWARGIGKVREVDTEQTEKLVDYCLPTAGCTREPPDPDQLEADCQPQP